MNSFINKDTKITQSHFCNKKENFKIYTFSHETLFQGVQNFPENPKKSPVMFFYGPGTINNVRTG